MRIDQLIENELLGKKLTSLEFGVNEKGHRRMPLGGIITKVWLAPSEDNSLKIYIETNNWEVTYAYTNEEIGLSE